MNISTAIAVLRDRFGDKKAIELYKNAGFKMLDTSDSINGTAIVLVNVKNLSVNVNYSIVRVHYSPIQRIGQWAEILF